MKDLLLSVQLRASRGRPAAVSAAPGQQGAAGGRLKPKDQPEEEGRPARSVYGPSGEKRDEYKHKVI